MLCSYKLLKFDLSTRLTRLSTVLEAGGVEMCQTRKSL